MTPNELPYHPPEALHSHSRAESAPDPLPVPWRTNIAPQNQLAPMHRHSGMPPPGISPPVSPQQRTLSNESSPKMYPPALKESLVVTPTSPRATGSIYRDGKHSKKKLRPLRTKSSSTSSRPITPQLSKSIDGLNLQPMLMAQPGSHTMSGVNWDPARNIQYRRNSLGVVHQRWASNQRLGQPADIQGLMANGMSSQAYNSSYEIHRLEVGGGGNTSPHGRSNTGSITSVEINTELFTPSGGGGGGSGHSSQVYSNSTTPMGSKGSSPQGTPLGPSPQASKIHFRPSPAEQGKYPVDHAYYHHQQQHPFIGGGGAKDMPPQGWAPQNLPPTHASRRTTSAKPSLRLHPHTSQQVAPDMSTSVGNMRSHEKPATLLNGGQNLPKIPNAQVDDKVGHRRSLTREKGCVLGLKRMSRVSLLELWLR